MQPSEFIPTIALDLRTAKARQTFSVGLASFTEAELHFMMETFSRAEGGSSVEFGVGQTEDGRQCMQFTIGKMQGTQEVLDAD